MTLIMNRPKKSERLQNIKKTFKNARSQETNILCRALEMDTLGQTQRSQRGVWQVSTTKPKRQILYKSKGSRPIEILYSAWNIILTSLTLFIHLWYSGSMCTTIVADVFGVQVTHGVPHRKPFMYMVNHVSISFAPIISSTYKLRSLADPHHTVPGF